MRAFALSSMARSLVEGGGNVNADELPLERRRRPSGIAPAICVAEGAAVRAAPEALLGVRRISVWDEVLCMAKTTPSGPLPLADGHSRRA